jgi:hypothetical protein
VVEVGGAGNAAGGDDVEAGGLGEVAGGGAGEVAVAGDVGVDDGLDAGGAYLAAEFDYVQAAVGLPAANVDAAVAGVEADGDLLGAEVTDGFLEQLGVGDGDGSQDDAGDAEGESAFDVGQGAQAAAKLDVGADLDDGGEGGEVGGGGRFLEGTVEVDDVEPAGTGRGPTVGDGRGVGVEGGLLGGVAVTEADDGAGAEVYGGIDFYGCLLFRKNLATNYTN